MPKWNNIHFLSGDIPGIDWAAAKAALEPERRQVIPASVDWAAERAAINNS